MQHLDGHLAQFYPLFSTIQNLKRERLVLDASKELKDIPDAKNEEKIRSAMQQLWGFDHHYRGMYGLAIKDDRRSVPWSIREPKEIRSTRAISDKQCTMSSATHLLAKLMLASAPLRHHAKGSAAEQLSMASIWSVETAHLTDALTQYWRETLPFKAKDAAPFGSRERNMLTTFWGQAITMLRSAAAPLLPKQGVSVTAVDMAEIAKIVSRSKASELQALMASLLGEIEAVDRQAEEDRKVAETLYNDLFKVLHSSNASHAAQKQAVAQVAQRLGLTCR